MSDQQVEIPKSLQWIGPLTIVLGILPMILSKPAPGVPLWVMYLGCSLFFFAGMIITGASFKLKIVTILGAAGIFLGPFILLNWLAFGPGTRDCTVSANIPFIPQWIGCRGGFIFFALLVWLVLILGVLPGRKKTPGTKA